MERGTSNAILTTGPAAALRIELLRPTASLHSTPGSPAADQTWPAQWSGCLSGLKLDPALAESPSGGAAPEANTPRRGIAKLGFHQAARQLLRRDDAVGGQRGDRSLVGGIQTKELTESVLIPSVASSRTVIRLHLMMTRSQAHISRAISHSCSSTVVGGRRRVWRPRSAASLPASHIR